MGFEMSSENWIRSDAYPFAKFRIYRKKRGVCYICGEEMYYGIGVNAVNSGFDTHDFDICRRCAKIIMYIRLSKWCEN